jgi:hypothetical protein
MIHVMQRIGQRRGMPALHSQDGHFLPPPSMRSSYGAHALTMAHTLQAMAYRAGELIQYARYTMSRRPIPRPLVLIFQLAAWIFLFCARIILRFIHPVVSLTVFYTVWQKCHQFWLSKLGGAWAPAFPVSRTVFVITLAAVPIWGACMAVLMLLWPILLRLWTLVRNRVPRLARQQRYEALAVDLDDLESPEAPRKGPHRKARDSAQSIGTKLAQRAGYFIIWGTYLSAALFGVYMLRTYELPIDHRFKKTVELANRVPKPEGYGTGGTFFDDLGQIASDMGFRKSIHRRHVL